MIRIGVQITNKPTVTAFPIGIRNFHICSYPLLYWNHRLFTRHRYGLKGGFSGVLHSFKGFYQGKYKLTAVPLDFSYFMGYSGSDKSAQDETIKAAKKIAENLEGV
ncbi:hypothetical protein FACS1894137_00970 [Spirochaetia bacterium]|nr:hypothetical protein FACS1894137_00970 [Spirochaetia bacterium]